jgi:hypothetical protein
MAISLVLACTPPCELCRIRRPLGSSRADGCVPTSSSSPKPAGDPPHRRVYSIISSRCFRSRKGRHLAGRLIMEIRRACNDQECLLAQASGNVCPSSDDLRLIRWQTLCSIDDTASRDGTTHRPESSSFGRAMPKLAIACRPAQMMAYTRKTGSLSHAFPFLWISTGLGMHRAPFASLACDELDHLRPDAPVSDLAAGARIKSCLCNWRRTHLEFLYALR